MNKLFLILLFVNFFSNSGKEKELPNQKEVILTSQIKTSELNILFQKHKHFANKKQVDSVLAVSGKIINSCSDHFNKEDLVGSEKYYELAERQFLKFRDYEQLGKLYNEKGTNYLNLHYYSIALKYFKQSETYYLKSPFPCLASSPTNNLGQIYFLIGDYKSAQSKYAQSLKYLQECKGVLSEIDIKNEVILRKMNISAILIDEKKYQQAEADLSNLINTPNFEKEVSTYIKLLVYENLVISKSNLANASTTQKLEDQVLRLEVNKLSNYEKIIYYEVLAYIYAFKSDKTKSYSNIYLALQICEREKDLYALMQNYNAMIFLGKKFGDFDNVMKYQQQLIELNDDFLADNAIRNVQEFSALYKLQDLEKEKQQFRDQNIVNTANLKVKEAENSRFKIIVVGLVFLAIISIIAARLYLKRSNLLASQKSTIERKNVELEKITSDLSLSNKTIRNTFSIIAHDLRNPFNALLGYSTLLAENFEDYEDDKKLHFAKMVRSAAETNFNMTQNLLVWSLKQHQGYEVQKSSQSIKETIEHVLVSLSAMIELKNILIELNVPANMALIDSEIISTILNNLFSNAIKFGFENSTIEINGAVSEDQVVLVIHNNGAVLSDERIESIVGFLKSDNDDENYKIGFGLKIAKELAVLHNGRIEFNSENGSTEVRLILNTI